MPDIDAATGELDAVRAICRRFAPGIEIRAFDSRVNGTSNPRSDLDIALMTGPREIQRRPSDSLPIARQTFATKARLGEPGSLRKL